MASRVVRQCMQELLVINKWLIVRVWLVVGVSLVI